MSSGGAAGLLPFDSLWMISNVVFVQEAFQQWERQPEFFQNPEYPATYPVNILIE